MQAVLVLSRTPAVVLVCLFLLVAGTPAVADDLGFFESRRILSDADDALAAGQLDEAAELYSRVADGTESGKGRHARALLGVAVSELGQNHAKLDVARSRLDAYLADPAADQKAAARALKKVLERVDAAPVAAPPESPPPTEPEPAEPVAEEATEEAQRIARLERQLAAAREEIAQKEKVIEELRKIVVEGGA